MTDPLTLAILGVAVLLLAGLLVATYREHTLAGILTKTPLSVLFVVLAALQPHPYPTFHLVMLVGFVLCVGGDFFLALDPPWAFRAGLVSFLLGHVAYIVAFFTLTFPGMWTLPGLAGATVLSGGVFLWLRPHLGKMLVPVLAYVIVITVMVIMAWTVLLDPGYTLGFRVMIFVGALLFYFSDITVARNRFVTEQFANRAVGLPMYYAGQFTLALALGMVS